MLQHNTLHTCSAINSELLHKEIQKIFFTNDIKKSGFCLVTNAQPKTNKQLTQ